MKRFLALLLGLTLAGAHALPAGADAGVASARSAGVVVAAPVGAGEPRTAPLDVWTDWDGNLITSLANCQARLAFIARTYNIATSNLRCDRRDVGLPPCPLYRWVLQVKSVDSLLPPEALTPIAAQKSRQDAPLC
ncbi:hypothetical protein [Catenuloplanes japonicus]|uniref:hypothetical protein n=1 Tax=Catenuloplanes japonicus TaxID=33876 RepID=UPI0012F877AE|nr:hypothetical protein [Catenuloplanes japonicus]